MNTLIENFVVSEKNKGAVAGVFFTFEYKEKVNYGNILCNGFFESNHTVNGKNTPCLSIAVKKDLAKWLPIFVHETCHMDQWVENSNLWITSSEYQMLNDWLSGKEFPIEDIKNFVHKVILLEADYERRTIEKIQQHNLPIDIGHYAQRANAYLYFYQWVIRSRSWYSMAPYEISDILYYMPKEVQDTKHYLQPLSLTREKLFNLCKEEQLS